jgi:glycosyltransferase involved in cell wall biosynthesis
MPANLAVVMLTDKRLPFERPTGIGVLAFELANMLCKLGVKVYFVCRGANVTKIINKNLKVYAIRNFTRNHITFTLNLYVKEKFNVIHTFSSSTIPFLMAAKFIRVPRVFHFSEVWRPSLTNAIRHKIMFALTDKIVCVSYNTKREVMNKFQVSESKIDVIYNGVNVDIFKPQIQTNRLLKLKREFGLEDFSPILLSVGMLQKRKGQHYVIESLPYVLKRFPHCCYVNAGGFYSLEHVAKLKNLAAKLKVEGNVQFLKPLPQSKLVELINLADVCIHPALHEGFGLAVAEEMACEKPVVAFNNSSIPEIIEHMKNGVLIKTGDIVGLASAIIELLSNRSLSKALAENARKRVVENFTWQKTATEIIKVYEQIVTKAGN